MAEEIEYRNPTHRLVHEILSDQRQPTPEEIKFLASFCKIGAEEADFLIGEDEDFPVFNYITGMDFKQYFESPKNMKLRGIMEAELLHIIKILVESHHKLKQLVKLQQVLIDTRSSEPNDEKDIDKTAKKETKKASKKA